MIQAAAICFLFYSVMDVNKKISDEADKILNVFNGKKAWYMKNSGEFHYRFFDGTITPDRILEAYKTVKEGDFIHFYLDKFLISICKDSVKSTNNHITS